MGRSTAIRDAVTLVVGLAACASPEAPIVDQSPTYARDVAPLLSAHCGSCHGSGGVAPFPLETYAQTAEVAGSIAKVTAERTMPPWPADASGECGTFEGQRWLSDADIAMLGAWAAAGAPLGDPADAAPLPVPDGPAFAGTMTVASALPYAVAAGPDEYRCFVVDPGLDFDQYITALAIELDQSEVVHHIQLFASDDATTDDMLVDLEDADGLPGYACGEEGVGADLRYIGVWAAGDRVRRWTDGSGILVRGGRRLVLQLHYHNHGSVTVEDQTRVALELAPAVDQIGAIDIVRNLALHLLPGRASVEAFGVHPIEIDAPSIMRGARIHMHQLGTRARLELVRGDQTTCLLAIPRWDFGWQLFYMFDAPIAVEPGDQLRLSCTYDTRSRDTPVTWGLGTDDEMCIGYTYITAPTTRP